MELVPILSTIILVGTIATFILAVAAYILYKIRERRSPQDHVAEEARHEEPHVLVEPARQSALGPRREAPADMAFGRSQRPDDVGSPEYAELSSGRHESLFWEYTDEGFVPVRTGDEQRSDADSERGEVRSVDSDRPAWT